MLILRWTALRPILAGKGEHPRMTRYLPLGFVVMRGALIGCQSSGIRAEAPGSERPIAARADAEGQYGLYHVTQFNSMGQPLDAKMVSSYHLQKGDPIGFRWVIDKESVNRPGAHLDLEAYAGDHHEQLGQITRMTEKYFWANTADWEGYRPPLPRQV